MEEKQDVVALTQFLPFVEELLDRSFNVHRVWHSVDREAAINSLRERATAVVSLGHTIIGAPLFDQLPRAKIVSLMSVGYDGIDVAAARARGVAVTNTPDVLTDDVADLAIGLVIAASRQIVAGDRYVRAGRWRNANMPLMQSLTGKTLGILGLGRIGKAVAQRAEALRMTVIYGIRPSKTPVRWKHCDSLIQLAQESDILVITIPGGTETQSLVSGEVLMALGPTGLLVNVARGSIVDEEALVEVLRSGRLGGAALDVFADEPNVPKALTDIERVVLQPHVGSATHQTRRKMASLMIENLLHHFSGRPLLTAIT
jgi:lactate dehydrogenase-like 2-hydroxyacid dehydrogenase